MAGRCNYLTGGGQYLPEHAPNAWAIFVDTWIRSYRHFDTENCIIELSPQAIPAQ